MWWRRSWLSLNGKVGFRRSGEGRTSYATQLPPPTSRSVQQGSSGSFLRIDQGPLQARIYESTGHIQLAGPNLAGTAHATTITLASPTAKIGGRTLKLGRIVASENITNGLELVQALEASAATVATRLKFEQEAVLRYEITDWRGQTPSETAIDGASPGGEHFYGFGEKFDRLEQGSKTVHTLTFDELGNKGDRSYKAA